jgi:hypothetical protein
LPGWREIAISKTFFARSTAMVVDCISDSSMNVTVRRLWHSMPYQVAEESIPSLQLPITRASFSAISRLPSSVFSSVGYQAVLAAELEVRHADTVNVPTAEVSTA